MQKKITIPIITLILILTIIIPTTNANDLTCEIKPTNECNEENIFLKLKSEDGTGYNNSHAELRNYTTPGYPYSICCETQTQELILNCENENTIEVLRLANQTNTHVQYATNFEGIKHHWDLNNNLKDIITRKKAINQGATWTQDRRNNQDQAKQFDGTSYIDSETTIDITKGTISFWGYTENGNFAFGAHPDTAGGDEKLYIHHSFTWGIGDSFGSEYSFPQQEWFHAALTYEDGQVIFYINGNEITTSTYNIQGDGFSPPLYFGAYNRNGATDTYNGRIDDIKIYDYALSQQEIQRIHEDGLIGHWKFNNDFQDYSGNENHATNNEAEWTKNRYGLNNHALQFNQTTDYVEIPDNFFQQTFNELTFSYWVKPIEYTNDYQVHIHRSDEDTIGSSVWWAGLDTNNELVVTIGANNGAWDDGKTNKTLSLNNWHHVTGTWDGNTGKVYLNGEEIHNYARTTLTNKPSTFTIGQMHPSLGTRTYESKSNIDNLRIYDEALTQQEINKLFIEQKSKYKYSVCIGTTTGNQCKAKYEECPQNYECLGSIASSEGWHYTNAHIASCDYYELNICCEVTEQIGTPTLLYPEDEDTEFIERLPEFNWTDVTYPLGGTTNYEFQLSYNEEFTNLEKDEDITQSNFQITQPLDFDTYYWRVRAYNAETHGEWSQTNTFTLITSLIITLENDSINFGTLERETTKNTTTNEPNPFHFINQGNIEADLKNITIIEPIWETEPLNTAYWRIKAREAESFNTANSITTWTNIEPTIHDLITELNYLENTEASVDMEITVPEFEPPGDKSATINFIWGIS